MNDLEPIHWFFLTLMLIAIGGFFAMQEMALVSLNRLDLLYDYAKGSRRAHWIVKLLRRPDRLFTTTLMLLNFVVQLGSECSRRFYQSLDISEGVAPFTQAFLVIVCAELAPMFIARQYPHQVAFSGIPVVYAVSILLRPLTAIAAFLMNVINWVIGGSKDHFAIVSREDLKTVVKSTQVQAFHEPENFVEKVGDHILAMHDISSGYFKAYTSLLSYFS